MLSLSVFALVAAVAVGFASPKFADISVMSFYFILMIFGITCKNRWDAQEKEIGSSVRHEIRHKMWDAMNQNKKELGALNSLYHFVVMNHEEIAKVVDSAKFYTSVNKVSLAKAQAEKERMQNVESNEKRGNA